MRDHRKVIAALERKAHDRACTPAERDALLAKAQQLRAEHVEPEQRRPRRGAFSITVAFGDDGNVIVNGQSMATARASTSANVFRQAARYFE